MKKHVIMSKWVIYILIIVLLISVVQGMVYARRKGKIYWTESSKIAPGKIRRANLNGTAVEDVITDLVWPTDITLDIHNLKIYWVNNKDSKIYRANFDGSNIEVIIDGGDPNKLERDFLHEPFSIALDTDANKIYWGNNGPWEIRRADIDGTNIEKVSLKRNVEDIFSITVDAESLEIDVKGGKMYFADSFQDNIGRANLDGSNYEHLFSLTDPSGLALDLLNRKMYWTHVALGAIKRSSLNSDNIETLLTEMYVPNDIVLDTHLGEMYWVGPNQKTRESRIQRANLDGSNVTTFYTGVNGIRGIALDTERFYDVSPDINKLTTIWANVKVQ